MPNADWRNDPGWVLVEWDRDFFRVKGEKPTARPDAAAELCNPAIYASLFSSDRIVASWWRPYAPEESAARKARGRARERSYQARIDRAKSRP